MGIRRICLCRCRSQHPYRIIPVIGIGSRSRVWICRSLVLVSAEQIADRLRARFGLLCGRGEAGGRCARTDGLGRTFNGLALPDVGPVASQPIAQCRVAPPPGSRGRHRIERRAHLTPEPIHPVSLCKRSPWTHGPPRMTRKRTRCQGGSNSSRATARRCRARTARAGACRRRRMRSARSWSVHLFSCSGRL
jgi:hypothetical protein